MRGAHGLEMNSSRPWRASGAVLLTASLTGAACMAEPVDDRATGDGRQPMVHGTEHGFGGAGAAGAGSGAVAGWGGSGLAAGYGGAGAAGGDGSGLTAGWGGNAAAGGWGGAGASGGAGGSSGGEGGEGGEGDDDSPCACPVGMGEYLPAGQPNPCGEKESRSSCQSEMCTVAVGDPNDDKLDFWEKRHCKWPPPPPNPPGDCSCPVAAGEYLPDDPDKNGCVGKTDRNSCQWAHCEVLVGDPNDDLIDPIAIHPCGWPPPPANPPGPCMCPVGPGEYLPENSACAGIFDGPTCGGTWCTVALGDPSDDEADFWELRPCDWQPPIVVAAVPERHRKRE